MMSERKLEITTGADGRIVLTSLGGGMPVGIRMTIDEAETVMNELRTALEEHWTREFTKLYYTTDETV